ncbi:glutathione S-transferase [Noviherbaspirillum sedimenti]|uniref:Glutathione S-transferase n=1 Tax=Noviherbaspirillum sedimenti TaxID=2320865 RepID=A0A3A3G2W8_9BURK|nr:glutathione S-transferase [Noviherbaspirillum sedimenti]RJG02817.1 glutathione S-transferase [Noviherbaspirillum sedimenti]
MKLFHSPASPYVRKVMVLACEIGLESRIERVRAVVSPVKRDKLVVAHNPTGHVPTLLLDDGEVLFDSRVICEYLDTLHDGLPLHPREAMARAKTQCLHALADGILDAAVLVRFELALRPAELRWPDWVDGQWAKVLSSLNVLESRWRPHLADRLDMGVIATACALGYLDFRFPDRPWRVDYPHLAAWYEVFAQRDSMQKTWPAPVV